MKHPKEQLAELVSLTNLFILRNYCVNNKQVTSPPTLAYFRKKFKETQLLKKATPFKPAPTPAYESETDDYPDPSPLTSLIVPSTTLSRPIETVQDDKVVLEKVEHSIPAITKAKIHPTIDHSKPLFHLEPVKISEILPPAKEWADFFTTHYPKVALQFQLPSDTVAKEFKNQWMEEQKVASVLIISSTKEKQSIQFLKNIAKAISLRFTHAKLVDMRENDENPYDWAQILDPTIVKLILVNHSDLERCPLLKNYYQENTEEESYTLFSIPIVFLSDFSAYFSNSTRKAHLWRSICNALHSVTAPIL